MPDFTLNTFIFKSCMYSNQSKWAFIPIEVKKKKTPKHKILAAVWKPKFGIGKDV